MNNARQTVRAGRLRLVRFAGARVYTYTNVGGEGDTVTRAGVTNHASTCTNQTNHGGE